jgi:hypothetical protein
VSDRRFAREAHFELRGITGKIHKGQHSYSLLQNFACIFLLAIWVGFRLARYFPT